MSGSNRKTKGAPDNIDIHVGQRLRIRRSLLGLSQEKLAESIDLTFQQIQKYERGMNRISAGRLYRFGIILDVPVAYFYEGLPQASMPSNDDTMPLDKETLTIARLYNGIPVDQRKPVRALMQSMQPDAEAA